MEIEGIADLPLHTGKVPEWLVPIMRRLAKAIIDVMVVEWGPEKVLERLSNPLWFQGFNNAIAMDWDSSGSTTVTMGILKDVVNPREDGFAVLGGKGSNALKVPEEAVALSKVYNIDPEEITRVSRLVAKVDTTLIQDGHQLYHHSVAVTERGYWIVIQQGMNLETRFARRYHWKKTENFTSSPHEAISGTKGIAVNVVEKEKERTRKLVLDLLRDNPRRIVEDYLKAFSALKGQTTLDAWTKGGTVAAISREAKLIYMKPVDVKRVRQVLEKVYSQQPSNLEEALLQGVGPSTARALYLIADLIYREPPSYKDPVTTPYDPFKYAFAVGGKDGIPYPVNVKVAEEVITTLEDFVSRAKLDKKDKNLSLNKIREIKLGVKKGT
ncbi:MAG: hypothetical protein ASUL_02589 [Candidatus Aramenus sulfurataquae]|jgi:hypothetical protein|uniref:DUF763 domain-containing protein n=3 Tax=Candidatus Aramenus sulfurataquae TaxID=1326980 RepID=W7KKH6_9CREN|nr:MAG: hypothetical protein ASUL_02589 [Candidatus Aramenus sulfurataquae]MCL7344128.1 DUF763 domain-containing protein [Candidatus Aramenus sulfurataquae]